MSSRICKLAALIFVSALFTVNAFADSCSGFPQVNDPEEVRLGKVKVLASPQLIDYARTYIFQALNTQLQKNGTALADISLMQTNKQYCNYRSSFYWKFSAIGVTKAGTHLNIQSLFGYSGGQTRPAILAMEIANLEDLSERDADGNVRTRIYRFDFLLGAQHDDTGCWRDNCGDYFKPTKRGLLGNVHGEMRGIALVQGDGYVVTLAPGTPKVKLEFRIDSAGAQTLKVVGR